MIEFNKVFLTGHLGGTPALSSDTSGHQYCSGTLLNRRTWTTRDRVRHEELNSIDWIAWGSVAEEICRKATKGRPVLIEGKLKQDSWRDSKTGEARSKVVILLTFFQPLDECCPQD